MRRHVHATAALRWCFAVVFVLLVVACGNTTPYFYCGGPPCPIGSPTAIGFPDQCRAMNKPWLDCWQQHSPPSQNKAPAQNNDVSKNPDISNYWISGTVTGVAKGGRDFLRVAVLYRDRDDFKETAGWSELKQGFASWAEWCQSRGDAGVVSAHRVLSEEFFEKQDHSSRCRKPSIIPGKPEAIWCVQCSSN